jgi:hypothetical protein
MILTRTPTSGCGWLARASDLLVTVERGDATLAWADDERHEPCVELDPAARQLFIWGRRPNDRGRLRSHLAPDLARLQALLSGY